MSSPRQLITRRGLPPVRIGLDPVLTAGSVGAIGFAAFLGGPLWAGLVACIGGTALYGHWQLLRQQEHQRQAQDNLSHFLHAAGSPEELAQIRAAADVGSDDLYGFLTGITTAYGGESVRGTARIAGDDQQEAVAPGISLTLAHDLGTWYAKLLLTGDTGRRFLNGEMTMWRARGKSPSEAIENVVRKAGQARQRQAIQDYAHRIVQDAE